MPIEHCSLEKKMVAEVTRRQVLASEPERSRLHRPSVLIRFPAVTQTEEKAVLETVNDSQHTTAPRKNRSPTNDNKRRTVSTVRAACASLRTD